MPLQFKHRVLLLISFFLIGGTTLFGQVILLEEDFSTASGSTPPAGWTVQTVAGDPLVDVWRFDNPGRREPNIPILEPFAIFDSDRYSDNGLDESVTLSSPTFDATTTESIILEFDQYFIEGYSGICEVEIYNGTSWISVYTNSSNTVNSQHSSLDITIHVQNITNAQLRFKWTGDYSRYWIIDNVKISTPVIFIEQFTMQNDIILEGIEGGSVAWGDYDNDDDLDILLTGSSYSGYISRIYQNNGDNSFTEQKEISLTGVLQSSVAWGDYDNDNYLDILLTGYTEPDTIVISRIYRNNGDNSFTEQTEISLPGISLGSATWGDYDNDGYLDILLVGRNISKIYRNNGDNGFIEQSEISLYGVSQGDAAWGDYDNDGYLDILLTGSGISKIYHNNGDNSFTEQIGISLRGVSQSSVAWGDYDNDGFLDILMIGSTTGVISLIYRNNGDKSFTEQTGISLSGVSQGSVAWGDYDNDGYLDILLNGYTDPGSISKIYHNNGDNSFTEQAGTDLGWALGGAVYWSDYDNDFDLDILLTGYQNMGETSTIYRNNNIVKNSIPSVPDDLIASVEFQVINFLWDKSIDFQTIQAGLSYNIVVGSTPGACDIVNPMSNTSNGFRKVIQIGNRSKSNSFLLDSSLPAGTYYWGVQAIDQAFAGSLFATSTFTITEAQAANLKFTEITTGSAKINWIRGNKEKCAVFMKEDSTGLPALQNNTSYTAETKFGLGSQAGDGWHCIYNGTGDSVMVTGLYGSTQYKVMVVEYSGELGSEIYLSSSNPTNPQTCNTQDQFSEETDITLEGTLEGSVAWGDYDNDGDLDILLTGEVSYGLITSIYQNSGDNIFTEQTEIVLSGIYQGSAIWGDYDNDDDLDILLTGNNKSTYISKIYMNNGDNSFTEQLDIELPGLSDGSIEFGDYDNDGDIDILMTGFLENYARVSKIYRNNGDNSFTEQTEISLSGISNGSGIWGDYDNDGDLDILLTGLSENYERVSKIYRNNGDNGFIEQFGISLKGVDRSSVAWGDYDNDGDLDIILSGITLNSDTGIFISKIYRNDGASVFSEQTQINIVGTQDGSVKWGDYDNDGDLDILLIGTLMNENFDAIIYRNNGDNSFAEQFGISLKGVSQSFATWGDYDNDGDLDILLTGNNYSSGNTKIYKNDQLNQNSIPVVPSSITAHLLNKNLELSWTKATDSETPQMGLTYNLRIGTSPGGCEILSPMSLPDGKRTIADFGNVGHNTSWTIDLSSYIPLPENIYYSVQTIDNGFLASNWTPEKSEISNFGADFLPYTVCQKNEVQFEDKSFSISYPITSYQWKFIEGLDTIVSILQDPTHAFQTVGTHQVELLITNSNNETTSRTESVTVLPSPLPDFTANIVCHGTVTTFNNLSDLNSLNITEWQWDFGDGITSNEKDPSDHGYLNPGDYPVQLLVTADNACSMSITKVVSVGAIPVAAITSSRNPEFCDGDSIILSNSYNENYNYQWKVGGVDITGADSCKYIAKLAGIYSLEVINLVGNCISSSDFLPVNVREIPFPSIISVNGSQSFCFGDSVNLSISYNPDLVYEWQLNGYPLGFNGSTLMAKSSGVYTAKIINSHGCYCQTGNSITTSFNPSPHKPILNYNGELSACSSDNEFIFITNPQSENQYIWDIDGNLIANIDNQLLLSQSGDYKVEAINGYNCQSISNITKVFILDELFKPVVEFQKGKAIVCPEEEVVLEVADFNNTLYYRWKNNGIFISGAEESEFIVKNDGLYTVEVSAVGCEIESEPQEITYKSALPKPNIIAEGSTVWYLACSNDTANIYRWYYENKPVTDGADYIYVANQQLGKYYVEISDNGECYTSSDVISIPENVILGTMDIDPWENLKIYPNPTPGLFTLEMDNPIMGDLIIDIFGEQGNKIINIKFLKEINHFSTQINLSEQPGGVYFIGLLLEKYKAERKLIVE